MQLFHFCHFGFVLPVQVTCLTLRRHLWLYLLTESLHEMEDNDLDALVADLRSNVSKNTGSGLEKQAATSAMTQQAQSSDAPPPPSNTAESSLQMVI